VTELFTDLENGSRGSIVGLWARRAVMTLFALISLAALLDLFGQHASSSLAASPSARMTVTAPETVRGGIFFQARIEIRALTAIEYPRLVFDDGWVEGMQVNSIEPAAESEISRDGKLVLSYGKLAQGDVLRVWLQFEVDPTNTGKRSYAVELDDETRPLARISRSLRVLP
jgi:hypothetical protein